ncbi:MAG: hypothetical protein E7176_06325 [Erysipelotrichaceae bacterium]|nr:hypothetical protein [Erysipelotrichaceae bacterium]
MIMKIILTDNELEINDVTELKEFSDKTFILEIKNCLYEIKGDGLSLSEVNNNKTNIKITGNIYSIEKKDNKDHKEKKSFIKKLFQ